MFQLLRSGGGEQIPTQVQGAVGLPGIHDCRASKVRREGLAPIRQCLPAADTLAGGG